MAQNRVDLVDEERVWKGKMGKGKSMMAFEDFTLFLFLCCTCTVSVRCIRM